MAYVQRQELYTNLNNICRSKNLASMRHFLKTMQVVGGHDLAEIKDDRAFLKALAAAMHARPELSEGRIVILEMLNAQ